MPAVSKSSYWWIVDPDDSTTKPALASRAFTILCYMSNAVESPRRYRRKYVD